MTETMTADCLRATWEPPENAFAQVNDVPEFEPDEVLEESIAWWRAYIQIWLFVFRHFPYLSATSTPTPVGPRLEKGQKKRSPTYCCVKGCAIRQKLCQVPPPVISQLLQGHLINLRVLRYLIQVHG